jgi:hypothetical protein
MSIRTTTTSRTVSSLTLLTALGALATIGWTRAPTQARPTITIVDVRPLTTNDPDLRDMLGHHLAIRVATTRWNLKPARSDTSGLDPRPRLKRWRLYIDGHPLSDSFTNTAYTPNLPAGDHWLVAELRRPDHSSLQPQVWSAPITLHIPHVSSTARANNTQAASTG